MCCLCGEFNANWGIGRQSLCDDCMKRVRIWKALHTEQRFPLGGLLDNSDWKMALDFLIVRHFYELKETLKRKAGRAA